MHRLYYDFHIHTGLSPCGDPDMSPNNIVNMALLNGLDAIAVTDHNTCGNVAAVMAVGKAAGLMVLPGMELETAEEAHMLCLFAAYEQAMSFAETVAARLPKIKNRPDIYGPQQFFDTEDEVTGTYEYLLVTATTLGLSEAVELVLAHGGAAVPAHVDRGAYSVVSNLGFIPPELPIQYIEVSKATDPAEFFKRSSRALPRTYGVLRSSDAHYLADINERVNFLAFSDAPTPAQIIQELSVKK